MTMGTDNAAANDHPRGKHWCLPTFLGLAAGGAVTLFGLFVVIADGLKLL